MEVSPQTPSSEILTSGLTTTFEDGASNILHVQITPRERNTKVGKDTIYISHGGKNIGTVLGLLYVDEDQKLEFVVNYSKNFSRESANDHIPGAVRATVAHLVESGIIERWYSDFFDNMSDDATNMYQRLAADERFEVFPPSDDTGLRYLIMKKISHLDTTHHQAR